MTLDALEDFREAKRITNDRLPNESSPDAGTEDDKLRQLGIQRELRREFTNFSTLSFALGVIGSDSHLYLTRFIIVTRKVQMCRKHRVYAQYASLAWRTSYSGEEFRAFLQLSLLIMKVRFGHGFLGRSAAYVLLRR